MADQTIRVEPSGSSNGGESSFGSGLMIGLVIIVLLVLGFFLFMNRGGVAPTAVPQQDAGTDIEVPSDINVDLNRPDGGAAQ